MVLQKRPNKIGFFIVILIASIFIFKDVNAAGLTVGNGSLNLLSGENLYYGVTSASNANGNFLLFEKGAGNTVFKIDYNGNITTNGALLGSNSYWNLSGNNLFTSSTSWNLGIGTTAPSASLDIFGKLKFTSGGIIYNTDSSRWLDMTGTLGDSLKVSGDLYSTAGELKIAGTGINYLMGSLGIGTTNPLAKLDIFGALKLGNTADACDATKTGTFRYDANSGQSYLCDGTRWLNQKNCGVMTDDEGHTYGTVQIGGQCWLAENINIGTMLAAGTTEPNTADNIIEKWCYNNDANNCSIYGGLYNWNEATRGSQVSGARGICAAGWHIPTDAEYNTLEKTVLGLIASPNAQYACNMSVSGWQRCADNSGTDTGGTYGAGKSLKLVGVGSGVGAGNDLVGFAGKLSGYRSTDGSYSSLGWGLYLWSSTPSGSSNAWRRHLVSTYSTVYRNAGNRAYGFSVRCLRD